VRIFAAQELMTARPKVSLDGIWGFSYDPGDVGEKQRWYQPDKPLPEATQVPGCAQAQAHASAGDPEKDPVIKREQFMGSLKYPCAAPAWYHKTFTVPGDWASEKVFLHLGGIHPAATLWLNGIRLGTTTSSRCPLRCNLTKYVELGEENTLVAKIFWPTGPLMNGLWDAGCAWQGLYRSAWVEAVPDAHTSNVQIIGGIEPLAATINLSLGGTVSRRRDLRAVVEIEPVTGRGSYGGELKLKSARAGEVASLRVEMPGAALWSPDSPNLHLATVRLLDGSEEVDAAQVRFGLREIRVEGRQIVLNGTPVFLRGGADDQSYPESVCPPASKEFFLKRLRTAKDYGFNYTKSCVEIFPSEFLDAADELGYLVCQEMPFGLRGKYRAVRQDPPQNWIDMYRREQGNIMRADRNHPSVILYAMASELGVRAQSRRSFQTFNQGLPTLARKLNPAALVMDVTHVGHGLYSPRTKLGRRNTDLIESCAEGQEGLDPLSGPLRGPDPKTYSMPWLLHEYSWWTALPDPAIAPQYNNSAIKCPAYPIIEESAQETGLIDELPRFVENSRKLKWALQKHGLEEARKHPLVKGYHFWVIHDFNWCPEGILSEFWEPPAEVSAAQFRMYNDDTALLLDDGERRCFAWGQLLRLGIQVSHYGPAALNKPVLAWRLVAGRKKLADGSRKLSRMPGGTLTGSFGIKLKMPHSKSPRALTLRVQLTENGRQVGQNYWDLWAFPESGAGDWLAHIVTDLPFLTRAYPELKRRRPESVAAPAVLVTAGMSGTILDFLQRGGRVVLLSQGALKEYRFEGDWRNSYTNCYRTIPYLTGQHGNMGTVVREHPALGEYPHEGWCDLNFAHLISGVYPIELTPFGSGRIAPIIRSIDHYRTMADKAYLFEIAVGKGALLATSLKIAPTYEAYAATRYLLHAMLTYAASEAFRPEQSVTREQLESAIVTTNRRDQAAKLADGFMKYYE